MADKTALRKSLALLRASVDASDKLLWDAAIGTRLLAWWRAEMAPTDGPLGVYWPLRGEPDLSVAYAELAASGVRLALPVVLERNAALGFAQWVPGEAMVKDAMGVAVPALLRMIERPPVLLIPCLGFNAQRYRLGYGGGYYDRTLAAAPRPLTVGVAYACQQVEFASAPHDVALDRIITEMASSLDQPLP
jgi:5,10-methenyltetrahydrofolate synthetase